MHLIECSLLLNDIFKTSLRYEGNFREDEALPILLRRFSFSSSTPKVTFIHLACSREGAGID